MKIVLITKKEGIDSTISTEELIKMFEEEEDLSKLKNAVERAEDRISLTWASVDMKDNAGELIPIEDIVKEQDTLLERHGPITDEHTNRVIGETIAYKVMEHPKSESLGVLHLDKTFAHNEFDDKVWSEIQSEERKGASVGGFNTGESKGIDEVTGEKVKVLEGFKQFETASVRDPCNPLALTEAYSVVAKSNISQVKKPAELDRCVQHLKEDPDFKPKDPSQTKEQAAYAVCQAQLNKKSEVEKFWKNVEMKKYINKDDIKKNIIKKGDIMDTKKAISQIEKILEKLKQDDKTPEEEEKQEEEEAKEDEDKVPEEKKKQEEKPEEEEKKKSKKQDEDEEKPEEEKKSKKQDEEEKPEEEVEKEEAAGDIAGEEPAKDQPEPPEPEDPNDADVFKRVKQLEKKFDNIKDNFVNKVSTPRPNTFVKKANDISKMAMDLATGKVRKTWNQVHKHVGDWMEEEVI